MINGEGGPWLAPGDNIQTQQYHGGLEMTKVLVADDDPLTMAGITALLDKSNFDVVATVNTGAAVLDTLASARPDLLILATGMPDRSGLDVLRTLRSRVDSRPVVLLTGCLHEIGRPHV